MFTMNVPFTALLAAVIVLVPKAVYKGIRAACFHTLRRHSFTRDRLVAKRKPPPSETLNTALKVEGDGKWTNVLTCLRAVGAMEGFRFAPWTISLAVLWRMDFRETSWD